MNKPEERKDGRTYCRACGERVVFLWADKPRYCAMCGDGLDWTTEKTLTERIAERVRLAEKNDTRFAHIELADAREALKILETTTRTGETDEVDVDRYR